MNNLERKRILFERCLIVLTISCITAYLAVFAFFNVFGFERFCNADTYADTMVAKKMWEQKTLFPHDWVFGNQYYVVATPVLAALLYGIIGSINSAMVVATEVMTVLILLSFFWLLRAITRDLLPTLICCLLLIASIIALYGPYSLCPQFFFLQASYYACYLITMFVVFGDYIRASQSHKRRVAAWVLSVLLCFATGVQSLRQTVIMVLPILANELLQAFRRILTHKRPWCRDTLNSLVRALSYGAANVAGIATAKLIPAAQASIYGEMKLTTPQNWLEKLSPVWSAICEITSLDYIMNGDYSRMFALYIIFLLTIFAIGLILWLARIKQSESALEVCWLLCLVGIIGVLLSTVLFNVKLRSVYIFMWYPLVAFSGLMILKELSFYPRCIAAVLVCVMSLAGLVYGYFPEAVMMVTEGVTDEEQMCNWAMDNGYEYIYGDYWGAAPQVAVYSNGKIEAGYWHPTDCIYQPLDCNSSQDIYGAEENEKAIYIFTSADEEQGILVAKERGISLVKVAEFGAYRAYTSPIPLMQR